MIIATTSSHLARCTLDALTKSGVRFAVLHREDEIAAGAVTSDLDTIVELPPRLVLRNCLDALREVGLHPIIFWPYDIGGAVTVFLSTADASDGVQLDLLHDPLGKGKYGLQTQAALEEIDAGRRWPTLGLNLRLAYLIRKRFLKRDHERLENLVVEVRKQPLRDFASSVRRVFAPIVADSILELVGDQSSCSVRRRIPRKMGDRADTLRRLAGRVLRPIGCWVEVEGEGEDRTARAIAQRFGRFLAAAESSQRPGGLGAQVQWWRSTIAPVRWRPGLVVSCTDRLAFFPRPDLRLRADSHSVADLSAQIVSALEKRVLE